MDPNRNIPAETPLDDLSGLRIHGIQTRRQRNNAEFQNMIVAQEKYLARTPTSRMAPFTLRWMLKLHKEAFGRVWKWAGQIRKTQKNIGLPPHKIELALEALTRDLACWRQTQDIGPVEQGARLHHRAVQIHPFEDCNGRWARLLANIWVKQRGGPLTVWPEETIGEHTSIIREEYIAALKQGDRGNLDPLINLHTRFSETTDS